jgi:hypothetical protein
MTWLSKAITCFGKRSRARYSAGAGEGDAVVGFVSVELEV